MSTSVHIDRVKGEYKEFDTIKVAQKLGLRFIRNGPSDERIFRCPICGDSTQHPNKGHLYINAKSGKFRCQRCYEEGNAITLWAKFHRINNKTAYMQLCDNVEAGPAPTRPSPAPTPAADINEKNGTYNQFLKVLSLNQEHKNDLLRRGFTELQISNNLYKSIPQDSKFRWKVTRYLTEKGFTLEGVPGFFTRNGKFGTFWDFVNPPGYLIPVRDVHGRIQALQIKVDDGKYIWFSSHGMPNGTTSNAPAHYTGGKGRVWVTEGPLKADVASTFLSAPFIGVPGIGSWKEADTILESLGGKELIVAFDSDYRTNPNVAKALRDFITNLKSKGYLPQNATWPASYGKGIDDALLKLHKKEISSITLMIEGVPVTIKKTVTTTVSVG
ncbi:MAG: hypothetical protein A4E53_01522 [Pelotomaculum sp. PtaB.Bin104]|nr:MAG: hypothetical protein A4E53_01522 [Pelotomaculum sp. PtaB.Bin104]